MAALTAVPHETMPAAEYLARAAEDGVAVDRTPLQRYDRNGRPAGVPARMIGVEGSAAVLLAGEILRRYPQLTVDEAHELEMRVKANRAREDRKQADAADAADYRRRSNFNASTEADQKAKMDNPGDWQDYLAKSDAALGRNEINQGMTYEKLGSARTISTADAVAEYMQGFGWNGLGVRQIAAAIGRDRMAVTRALDAMIADAAVVVKENNTRGKSATRRKVYYTVAEHRPLVEADNANPGAGWNALSGGDTYFGDTGDAHEADTGGAGGGRKIEPKKGAE